MQTGEAIHKFIRHMPILRHVSFASWLYSQTRFLSRDGKRKLVWGLLAEVADEVTFERSGVRWTVSTRDMSVAEGLFFSDSHDRMGPKAVIEWAMANGRIDSSKVILDIGANMGSTTIPFLQFSPCRVIAIEPAPQNLTLLRRNLIQNDVAGRVTILECAISDHIGRLPMRVYTSLSGAAELAHRDATPSKGWLVSESEIIEVATTRLDALLDDLHLEPTDVAFAWSDTQGSETAVARTGASLWAAGTPLYAELAPKLLRSQGQLDLFLSAMPHLFEAFIRAIDLIHLGPSAPPTPIQRLTAHVAMLDEQNIEDDALFLPRKGL